MTGLPLGARVYTAGVTLIGATLLLVSLQWLPSSTDQWILFGVLLACSAVTQLFPVPAHKDHYYDVSLVFVFAGVLILPMGAVSLLILLGTIPEWIKSRSPWYKQAFNVGGFILCAVAVRFFFTGMSGLPVTYLNRVESFITMIAAVIAFTILNHTLVAVVLRLTSARRLKETGIFDPYLLLTDAALSLTGVITLLLWHIHPIFLILIGGILFLIYRALDTPNLLLLARTDSKTGLYNARHFDQALKDELQRAKRFERPLSVIMADMDLLRNINNNYGHLAGDLVLKGVADIIKGGVRDYDIASRFGGEEFAILLPETDAEQALFVAERIRKRVEEAHFRVSTSVMPIQTTLSFGIAIFPSHGMEPDELIHAADLAVYRAKLAGRNQTQLSPQTEDERGSVLLQGPALMTADIPFELAVPDETPNPSICQVMNAEERDDPAEEPCEDHQQKTQQGQSAPSSRPLRRSADVPFVIAILVAVVGLTVPLLWMIYRPWDDLSQWQGLLALVALAAITQSQAIDIYGHGKISTAAILVITGGMLFGIPGALIVAPVISITQWILRRGLLYRSVYDLGNVSLSAVCSAAAYHLLSSLVGSDSILTQLPLALVAGFTFYIVNVGLLSLAMGLSEKSSLTAIWHERFRWLCVYYLAFGLLALALALVFGAVGLYGLFIFFVPIMMMPYVMKQYVDRTEENVSELKRVNAELISANEEVSRTLVELRTTYDATILALSAALDSRDSETEGHSQRVANYAAAIGRQMGLAEEQMKDLVSGALLHDVGKIGVPDAILLKPGPLTDEEWSVMATHPLQGDKMLCHIDFLKGALPIVLHHHERFDGSGYPSRLRGKDIPLGARIFAIADTYDAMTSNRPYRKACSHEVALAELLRCSGLQFDPDIIEVFRQISPQEIARPARPDITHLNTNPELVEALG
jgi:diguanylate cyclase (GGDEF)-like protein